MKELAAERATVRDAVRRLRMQPVLFEAGARPHPPRDLYKAYVEQSDVFIGIYAQEYGWVGPGMQVSGIEEEYQLSAGKPRLIYVKQAAQRDERLNAMLTRIADEGDVSYKRFGTVEELADLVLDDLALILTERFHEPGRASDRATPTPQLPATTTRILGREKELSEISALFHREEVRLVTLTGPGGTGKTRLALQVAWELSQEFGGEVYFVSLSPVHDPSLVLTTVAQSLHIREASGRPLQDLIAEELRDRPRLVVLDNLEQVIEAATELAGLLSSVRELKLLVTSRQPLQIYGEHEYPVAPLPLPTEGAPLDGLLANPAVALFLERAQAARPDVKESEENARTAALICERLDGLPLAIELAAANTRFLSLAAVLARLQDRLDALSGRARDLPERQRTMRAAITWSYDLLDGTEKRLFERLSVFAGGGSLDAIEAVANPDSELGIDTLDGLFSLSLKSLLRTVQSEGDEQRFEMLEVIREYARERLAASGELDGIRDRHCRNFSTFAAANEDLLFASGPEVRHSKIAPDYPNWREALLLAIERLSAGRECPEGVDGLLRFLLFFWFVSGRLSEGRELSEQAIEVARGRGDGRFYASALGAAGAMAMWQGNIAQARRFHKEAIDGWRQERDPAALAFNLMMLGVTAVNQGDPDFARQVLEEALGLMGEANASARVGIVLMHLGNVALERGDYETAENYCERGLENQKRLGSAWGVASLLNNLGEVARCRGDYDAAGRHYGESLRMFEDVEATADVARGHHSLAYVALRMEDFARARDLFRSALEEFRRLGYRRGVAEAIQGLASLAAARGDLRRAARLLGASRGIMEAMEAKPWPADRVELENDIRLIQDSAGQDLLDEGLREGRLLPLEDAVEYAMRSGDTTTQINRDTE